MTAPLDSHIGFQLRLVSNAVSAAFAARLEGAGSTVPEWVLLRALFDAPATAPSAPSALAARLGLTRGGITKIVDRLAAKGFARREGGDDGRARPVALTEAGRALVPALAALAEENEREFFDHLTEGEREALTRILRSVAERRGLSGAPVG